MCRKNILKMLSKFASVGSLPRVQEKQLQYSINRKNWRITPACAGKTVFLVQMMKHHQDHPRVCGKNIEDVRKSKRVLGSPPRVREKQEFLPAGTRVRGITPACAGKTTTETS